MTTKEKEMVRAIETITQILGETHKCLEALSATNQTADTRKRAGTHAVGVQSGLRENCAPTGLLEASVAYFDHERKSLLRPPLQ